ncbi:Tetratricopeptide TPR2 [Penicillium robsamsonii]|uniref:Tetratricopeptide TPR2 n=1 Tax=Penicillium robsamsonii TaxID=1792511 RepID=UPI0025466C38|nr:Tetratricopeptide TPR2 [Penicillium robsamsonii]KAJ5836485.1 Tetratricopeptide TPR2 [Penicillium robsamsonii]
MFQMPRPSGGSLGRTKNILHFIQGFSIFLAWAITIAIWTKGGSGIDGRTGWYWGLCWLSIPGLIYLVAVPMWPRARRFGNVYAFACVDILYSILWLSAWICLASYVAQGKSKGASSDDDKKSTDTKSTTRRAEEKKEEEKTGCDNWAYGSATKCKLSTATTIIGVIIFVLFVITAWMSFRNVMHFRRTGTLPDAVSDPTFAAQSKAAFSSNPAHDFEEDEDNFRSGRGGGMGASSHGDQDEDYALLHQSEVDDLGNAHGRTAMQGSYDPTAPAPGGILHDYNSSTGYGGAHGQHYVEPSTHYNPSDYTPSEYTAPPTGFGGSSKQHRPYNPKPETKVSPLPKMASEIDLYNQYPLYMDPSTQTLTLMHSSGQTPSQTAAINTELEELNQLHQSLLTIDPPNIPPAPLPVNPKRSAQISKLRDSANAAHRKANYDEAIKLYSYAIDMGLSRPGWEPVGVAREELSGLYANRAQAQMALQAWPEALVDAKASVDSKPVGNVKAWWRIAKCLAEMSRYEEARKFLHKSLDIEGKDSEGGKELFALLGEVDRALLRGLSA